MTCKAEAKGLLYCRNASCDEVAHVTSKREKKEPQDTTQGNTGDSTAKNRKPTIERRWKKGKRKKKLPLVLSLPRSNNWTLHRKDSYLPSEMQLLAFGPRLI